MKKKEIDTIITFSIPHFFFRLLSKLFVEVILVIDIPTAPTTDLF